MDDHILEKAKETIAAGIDRGRIHIMIGLPLGSDTPYDPTEGAETAGRCTKCGKQVRSTELKDAILFLTKDRPIAKRPALLCEDCNRTIVRRMTPGMLPQN